MNIADSAAFAIPVRLMVLDEDRDEASALLHEVVKVCGALVQTLEEAHWQVETTTATILSDLDEMYREAFERAKLSGDATQMATLDFAYRREQLYFEILLDVRDALERR